MKVSVSVQLIIQWNTGNLSCQLMAHDGWPLPTSALSCRISISHESHPTSERPPFWSWPDLTFLVKAVPSTSGNLWAITWWYKPSDIHVCGKYSIFYCFNTIQLYLCLLVIWLFMRNGSSSQSWSSWHPPHILYVSLTVSEVCFIRLYVPCEVNITRFSIMMLQTV